MASSAIDYITIKGFKSIASIEKLKLRPINVLIGANGAGKSNFIGVFGLLQAALDGRLNNYVKRAGGAEKLLHFGSKTTKAILVEISFRDHDEYSLRLEPTSDDELFPPDDQIGLEDSVRVEKIRWVRDLIGGWLYHLQDTGFSSPMRKTANVDDNRFLRADGSNLAACLYYFRERHQRSYEMIRTTIQRVAPFFLDFILEPLLVNPDTIKLEWKHRKFDHHFGVSALSDGTLRFIALAALFLQPKEHRPSLILVDEPELGLHPYAIGLLASMIKQASVDTQVIVATQSALLLDHFEPEDVLVADCVDGATQLKRLDSARLAKWLDDYSLGQLWEKNELGGRPGSE